MNVVAVTTILVLHVAVIGHHVASHCDLFPIALCTMRACAPLRCGSGRRNGVWEAAKPPNLTATINFCSTPDPMPYLRVFVTVFNWTAPCDQLNTSRLGHTWVAHRLFFNKT